MAKILIVEDELYFRKNIKRELSRYGEVFDAANLPLALEILDREDIDVAFVDLVLNESTSANEGLVVLEKCSQKNISSIVLTGNEKKSMISKAYALGCRHYFSKIDFEINIHKIVGPLLENYDEKLQCFFNKTFITNDQSLRSKIKFIQDQACFFEQNIMITGPSGVGKTKIAKHIHQFYGPHKPFIHVNLSELPENLIESELFGHRKGSFTGATHDKTGLLEKANGGILFFDEVGAIPLNLQKKLLKVIEEKKITPVGGTREKAIDFKLITATCDNIPQKINDGRFRVDFYFRIKGIEINIPPLSQRRGDILPLIDHIIAKSPRKVAFHKLTQECLVQYNWPGNVRELENMVKELMIKSSGLITQESLPSYVVDNVEPFSLQKQGMEESFLSSKMKVFLKKEGLPSLVKRVEQEAVKSVLEEMGGGVNEPCRRLKISKGSLYRIQRNTELSHGSSL